MKNLEQTSEVQYLRCAAVFKDTGQRCAAVATTGKKTCPRHGGKSTGPKTTEGRQRCAAAKLIHGQETTTMRMERSLASARLALLESVGYALGMMTGNRTRGRRPDRMSEAYPELQAIFQKRVIERAKHSA